MTKKAMSERPIPFWLALAVSLLVTVAAWAVTPALGVVVGLLIALVWLCWVNAPWAR